MEQDTTNPLINNNDEEAKKLPEEVKKEQEVKSYLEQTKFFLRNHSRLMIAIVYVLLVFMLQLICIYYNIYACEIVAGIIENRKQKKKRK